MTPATLLWLRPQRGRPHLRLTPKSPLSGVRSPAFVGYHSRMPGLGRTLVVILKRPLHLDSLVGLSSFWNGVSWTDKARVFLQPDGAIDILLPESSGPLRNLPTVGYLVKYTADDSAEDRSVEDSTRCDSPVSAFGTAFQYSNLRPDKVLALCIPLE